MDIPEIRAEVGLHLRGGDEKPNRLALTQCARVCKAWRDTFTPLLYDTIDTSHFSVDTPGMSKLISLSVGLQRHGRHLTELSLSLSFPYLDVFTISTGNIKRLSIVQGINVEIDKDPLEDQRNIRTLLNNNPGIDYLLISWHPGFDLSRSAGQIVQHCLQLKELYLVGGIYDLADAFYLHGLSRLSKVFIIDSSDIKVTEGHLVRTPTLPSLRHFGLSNVRDDAVPVAIEMISNWPQLESLALSAVPYKYTEIPTSPQTRDALRMFQPSAQISKLKLENLELTDQDLARILDGCPALSNLEICGVSDGEVSFASLLKLAGTLTNLIVVCEKSIRYWTPQRLLCCLPKLKQFGCDVMDVDELFFSTALEEELLLVKRWQRYVGQIHPGLGGKLRIEQAEGHSRGRWICTGLQYLQVDSMILSSDSDRNKAFMDQLSDLQDIQEFLSFASYCRAIFTQASDHFSHPGSALVKHVSNEPIQISYSCNTLSRYDLMRDPSKQWIPTLWPRIQGYMGPASHFTAIDLDETG